jgi:hypothetical protein
MSRKLADQVRNFIPDLTGDNRLAALDLFPTEVNMSCDAGDGNLQQRAARAGMQIARLASDAFEGKACEIEFLADMGRYLQLANVERG